VNIAVKRFLKICKFVVLEPPRQSSAIDWFYFFHKKTPVRAKEYGLGI
jgi:hypothetical protein